MNLIPDDVMWDIIFEIISNYEKGSPIASKIIKASCNYITNSVKDDCSTDDICDSILGCFDYYNNYVTEKNIDIRIITEDEYNLAIIMLNSAINFVLEEKTEI